LEITGANIRKYLGDVLFLIRFPIMPPHEFTKFVTIKEILTPEETVAVYKYLTLPEDEK